MAKKRKRKARKTPEHMKKPEGMFVGRMPNSDAVDLVNRWFLNGGKTYNFPDNGQ